MVYENLFSSVLVEWFLRSSLRLRFCPFLYPDILYEYKCLDVRLDTNKSVSCFYAKIIKSCFSSKSQNHVYGLKSKIMSSCQNHKICFQPKNRNHVLPKIGKSSFLPNQRNHTFSKTHKIKFSRQTLKIMFFTKNIKSDLTLKLQNHNFPKRKKHLSHQSRIVEISYQNCKLEFLSKLYNRLFY